MFKTPCVIFAGGKSSRMGEDKALLPFGEASSLVHYQYHRLSKLFKYVYISTKNSSKIDFEAPIIEDISAKIDAPTIGFIASFEQLKEDFFVLSVDAPFVNEAIIGEILKYKNEGYDAVIAQTKESIHPMCGIYSYALLPKFLQMMKDNSHRLGYLLKTSNTKFVNFDDETPFANLNHPHEYQEALTQLNH